MKKILAVILFLMIPVLIAYFTLDSQLYYCGKSRYSFYNKLPLKIQPQYWNWGYDDMGDMGFVLVDESESQLIARGDSYFLGSDKSFIVREIIKYGYTNEELVAEVQDMAGKKHLIKCLKNNDDAFSTEDIDIAFNVLDDSLGVDYGKYKWVEVEDEYFTKVEEQIAYLARIFAVLVLGLFVIFLVLLKRVMYSRDSPLA